MGIHIVWLFMLTLSLGFVSSRHQDLFLEDVRRRDQGDDFFCEDGILRELKANIEIIISNIASGCDNEEALFDIGRVIADVVAEIEADIPRYVNEKMETTMCPLPLIELTEARLLRANQSDMEDSDKELQKKKKKRRRRRRRRRKKKRERKARRQIYRYRGGVKCTRCLTNNSDRRLQDSLLEICKNADVAIFAADMAGTAVQKAGEALDYFKKQALEQCQDIERTVGAVANANALLQQCKDSHELAMAEAKRAILQCTKARNANPADDLTLIEQVAGNSANNGLNAARNGKRRYILLRDSLERSVCDEVVLENSGSVVTIEQVCKEADLAEVGLGLASSAVSRADESFAELRERALECDDLLTLQEVVTNAKASLEEARKAQRLAKNGAKVTRGQCTNARNASSGAELREYMQAAEKASDNALDAAEKAREGVVFLIGELDRIDECQIAQSPITPVPEKSPDEAPVPEEESPDDGVAAKDLPQAFGDESLYEESLKEWLVRLAQSLYDKLPGRLMEEYERATFPEQCNIEGFDVKVRLTVLETSQELTFWITEETCDLTSR